MRYKFRPLAELYWGILTTVLLAILPGLLTFDPAAVVDWKAWALALLGAAIRPAVGVTIDYIRRSMSDTDSDIADLSAQIAGMSPEDVAATQRAIDARVLKMRMENSEIRV